MIGFIRCNAETRPEPTDLIAAAEGGYWTEIDIQPFDRRMAPDGQWRLQWGAEDLIVIPPWLYCLLGLLWPLLRLVYRRALVGQHTEYGFKR